MKIDLSQRWTLWFVGGFVIIMLLLGGCTSTSSGESFNDNVSWRALKMDQQRHRAARVHPQNQGCHGRRVGNKCVTDPCWTWTPNNWERHC